MQVSVPSVLPTTTLDLDEEDATSLATRPETAAAEASETGIETIEVGREGESGSAEGESDETKLPSVGVVTHAGSDMTGTLGGTGSAESISTFVARHPVHVRVVHGLQDPSVRPTAIETSTAILRAFNPRQRRLHTTTTITPSGVPELHTRIGFEVIFALRIRRLTA